jgi:hypothetical protein
MKYLLLINLKVPRRGETVHSLWFKTKDERGKHVAKYCQNWLGFECWDGERTDQYGNMLTDRETEHS